MNAEACNSALITFITRNIELNAIFYGNRRLTRKILESGRRVELVGLDEGSPEAVSLVPPGATWRVLGARRVRRQVFSLAKYYRSHRPAVVLASGFNEGLVCVAASWLARTRPKIIVRVHIVASTYLASQKKFFDRYVLKLLMKCAFRPPVRVAAVSSEAARDLERLLGFRTGSVDRLYDPVLDDFPKPAVQWKHPWIGDDDLKLVLAAGVLIPRKDFPTLIRAFKLIQADNPKLRLLIAGEGNERNRLESLVDELGLSTSVELVGLVPNTDIPYKRADLFVCSSTFEGLCNVIIEALAAGCRVVSTDCPVGPAEVLEQGRLGQLVPVGDVSALAEAMRRTLSLPGDPHAAVRRAMDFHIDKIWPEFLALIDSNATAGGTGR